MGNRFPKPMRLRKRSQFLAVQNHPSCRRVHGQHFLLLVAPQSAVEPPAASRSRIDTEPRGARVGITVSKKVGNAVTRNRVKRLVRECVRSQPELLPTGCDVVVIAKRKAATLAGLGEACAELARLGRRARQC